jgi:replicative DNA helicase
MSLLQVAALPRAKQLPDGSYNVPCPVPGHGQGKGDRTPSCHVWHDKAKDRMAAQCFAGCEFEDVKRALEDLGVWDKPKRDRQEEKEYHILDGAGKELGVHIRIDKPDGSKTFKWKPRGLKPESMLYGLHLLGKKPKAGVVVCEGEKAADAAQLAVPKAVALGTVCGASSCPNAAVLKQLEGRIVVLWPDNDEMGLKHMRRVAQLLKGVAREIRMVAVEGLKPKADAADLFKADALKLVREAAAYDPERAPRPENIRTFVDVEKEVLKTLDEYAVGNRQDVVPTGLRRLDGVLNGGWQKSAMTIIAGPSGAGKTTLVLQFADAAGKALIVAPEMTVASLARRMLLRRAGASMRDFKHDEAARKTIVQNVAELLKTKIVFLDSLEPSMEEIRDAALWFKPPLIVLDYAQFLTSMEDPKRYLALAKFAQFSIELAMETKAAVLMTSQVNVSKDGEYSLRESAMLNHKAHAQLDFYVPLAKNKVSPPAVSECYFWVAKQRDGISLVKVEGFMYERAKYRVYEAAREEQDEPYWMR